jgi:hypothetical protein
MLTNNYIFRDDIDAARTSSFCALSEEIYYAPRGSPKPFNR